MGWVVNCLVGELREEVRANKGVLESPNLSHCGRRKGQGRDGEYVREVHFV